MTPEQELQFNSFGCIPRCLIKLAEKIQKPVTKQEFCNRFADRFYNPKVQYGLLNPDFIPEIARELSLASNLIDVEDYDEVASIHDKKGFMILVGK